MSITKAIVTNLYVIDIVGMSYSITMISHPKVKNSIFKSFKKLYLLISGLIRRKNHMINTYIPFYRIFTSSVKIELNHHPNVNPNKQI